MEKPSLNVFFEIVDGVLVVKGARIDSIARQWMEDCCRNSTFFTNLSDENQHKGVSAYHITLLTAHETENVEKNKLDALLNVSNIQIFDVGVGCYQKKCYYVVLYSPELDALRANVGLAKTNLYILLADASKNNNSTSCNPCTDDRCDIDAPDKLFQTLRFVGSPQQHARRLAYILEQTVSSKTEKNDAPDLYNFADYLRSERYLCGLYFSAKLGLRERGLKGTYEYLLKELFQKGDANNNKTVSKREWKTLSTQALGDSVDQYGTKICKVLNVNVTKQYHRQARVYLCEQLSRLSSPQTRADTSFTLNKHELTIRFVELPRNFSFVTPELAGSSIFKTRAQLEALTALGVTDLITLRETPLPAVMTDGVSLRYHFFSVNDMYPPTTQQMKRIMEICDGNAENEVRTQPIVVVHCMGGVGRTATALAARLMWKRAQTKSEAKIPLQLRKTLLTQPQETFLSDWYSVCATQSPFVHVLTQSDCNASSNSFPSAASGYVAPSAKNDSRSSCSVKLPPLIMLVGLPASGKSTFAAALCSHSDKMCRVSQDEHGRKNCVERLTAFSKSKTKTSTTVLDRCNSTIDQRREWLKLAGNRRAWAVFFNVAPEECKWRIVRRRGHPTIHDGKGTHVIDAVVKTFEKPTVAEGFEKIVSLTTLDDVNTLLCEWNCKPVSFAGTLEDSDDLPLLKFPRTRHIANLGAATRDDLLLSNEQVAEQFLNRPVCVEEKVDGANLGISIRNNQLCVQNRSHFVTSAYHAQFKYLDKWLSKHSNDLWTLLDGSERYILYGEWLYARHSIQYTSLHDWFVAFDMYDRLEQRFWSRKRLEKHMRGTQLHIVPLIGDTDRIFTTVDDLRVLAQTRSVFYDGPIEGVYVRTCNNEWLLYRGKIVRADFLLGDEFWSKRGIVPNSIQAPNFS